MVTYGKWIFWKRISVDRKIKAFDSENIFSQNFTFKSFSESRKERKRERKDSHAQVERERERSWTQKSGDRRTTDEIVEPTNSESHEPTNSKPTTHEWWTHEQQTHDPRMANPWTTSRTAPIAPASRTVTDLAIVLVTGELHRYRSRSCDFDFLLSLFDLWFFCCCCGGVGGGVLVVFLLCDGGFCVGDGGK